MLLPVFPWWGLSLGLAVRSLPFLAVGCWLLWGLVGVSCVVCVCGAGAVRAFVCFVCLSRLCWWWQFWGWWRVLVCGRLHVWCVGGVFWLLAPASPGLGLRLVFVWVWGLCVVVPRQSWLRGLGAVPRDSWLGSAAGGGWWSLAIPG